MTLTVEVAVEVLLTFAAEVTGDTAQERLACVLLVPVGRQVELLVCRSLANSVTGGANPRWECPAVLAACNGGLTSMHSALYVLLHTERHNL